MNQATSQVLVPPRPNLGPEPWTEVPSNGYLPLLLTSLGLCALGAWVTLADPTPISSTRSSNVVA